MGKESFWQPESYDHWIRTDEEKSRIASYIRNNPVKARLCERPEDWQWSVAGMFNASPGYRSNNYSRVPVEEIIHYARPVDAESTRPAPWVAA